MLRSTPSTPGLTNSTAGFCPGRQIRAPSRPQRTRPLHHPHGASQSHRRRDPGHAHSVYLPGQRSQRADRHHHYSVRAAFRRDSSRPQPHSGKSAFTRRTRFRHGGGWLGGHGGEHHAPRRVLPREEDFSGGDRRCRPRSPEAGLLRPHHYHRFVSAHLHPAARRGPSVPPHGVDRSLRPAGRSSVRTSDRAGALPPRLPRRQGQGMAQPDAEHHAERLPAHAELVLRPHEVHARPGSGRASLHAVPFLQRNRRLRVSSSPR